ncbi:glycosyltransferase [Demequina sp.]|uniref:glycosyltransferase n=1 Tax=Demequina sp. TaxID=2050685 RepID=UPI0025DB9956|nr:glycosyltransferase [Demequina sp.]
MWILVPAYEPDELLPDLVRQLCLTCPVLVVDDGSGRAYAAIFEAADAAGAVVLHHPVNRGKAAALRTGFAWLTTHATGEGVVCADSDGQHRPGDVALVAATIESRAARREPAAIVLGARAFAGEVPRRSRVGNRVTTALMAAATGRRIVDTQTGLRGYPAELLPWALAVKGERFAYELQLLLEACRSGIPVVEVPASTVYLEGNASSHFRPLVDSARVMWPLALFAASSLIAFAVDTVALLVLSALTGSLALSVSGARLISASTNFAMNRRAVFGSKDHVVRQAVRYAMLALALVALSFLALDLLTRLGVPLLLAKVATDLTLWLLSYGVQRTLVFRAAPPHESHEATALAATSQRSA